MFVKNVYYADVQLTNMPERVRASEAELYDLNEVRKSAKRTATWVERESKSSPELVSKMMVKRGAILKKAKFAIVQLVIKQ